MQPRGRAEGVKTHCYALINKQRINKLSTNVYVICKFVVNQTSLVNQTREYYLRNALKHRRDEIFGVS